MVYESAIKQIETKLEVLNKEYKVTGRRNPIDSVRSRIKSPVSIAEKLEKKGFPVTFQAMTENLSDIAGVRVVCPYISDIYTTKDMLLRQPDITLIEEKDYIENPKPSGYRSLHIVVEIPVYLSNTKHDVKVEIQLRTIAMDFWASLDHKIQYKFTKNIPEKLLQLTVISWNFMELKLIENASMLLRVWLSGDDDAVAVIEKEERKVLDEKRQIEGQMLLEL